MKSLGKIFNGCLRDTAAIQKSIQDLKEWLNKIDKTGFPGRFKAWIFQHAVLPCILWLLLLYEFTITTMGTLERTISNSLRRWLGLLRCLSCGALYGKSNVLQLPFSSLEEEFKVLKMWERLQYIELNDPKVALAGIQTRSGRKWSVEGELRAAEERLRHKVLLGTVAIGKAGLFFFFPSPKISKTKGKEKRKLIQEEVHTGTEEVHYRKMVSLHQQGAWKKWESIEKKKITWQQLWRSDFSEVRFMIQSVYILPSPSNLQIWGKRETPGCQVCSR